MARKGPVAQAEPAPVLVETAERELRVAEAAHEEALDQLGVEVDAVGLLELESEVRFAAALVERARRDEAARAEASRVGRLVELSAELTGGEIPGRAERVLELAAAAANALGALHTECDEYAARLEVMVGELREVGLVPRRSRGRRFPIAEGVDWLGSDAVMVEGSRFAVPRPDWADKVCVEALLPLLGPLERRVRPLVSSVAPATSILDRQLAPGVAREDVDGAVPGDSEAVG